MASTSRANGERSIYRRHDAQYGCPPTEPTVGLNGKTRMLRPEHRCKAPWVGAYVTGWRGTKPIRKKVSGTSRTDVNNKLNDLRDKVRTGELPSGRIPTLAEWLTYWLERIVPDGDNHGTQRVYGTYVRRYLIPLLGQHRLDRLTPEHIGEAWAALLTLGCPDKEAAKPLSGTTVHNVHACLSRALKVAAQRRLIAQNPATLMDAPSKDPQDVDILSKQEADRVIATAREARNAARWTVAFSLGLRQGEALGLRWEDVDLDAPTIVVRKALKRVKGQGLVLGKVKGKKPRTIVIPAPLLAELQRHRADQDLERDTFGSQYHEHDYVFSRTDGLPVDPKDDWETWRDLLASAGIEHVKLHSARHTAATMLLAMGVAIEVVAEILGHTDLRLTRGYQHRVDDLHIDAARRIGEFWG